MNGWIGIFWLTLMLCAGSLQAAAWAGLLQTGPGQYASSHDDPSPGPNALF